GSWKHGRWARRGSYCAMTPELRNISQTTMEPTNAQAKIKATTPATNTGSSGCGSGDAFLRDFVALVAATGTTPASWEETVFATIGSRTTVLMAPPRRRIYPERPQERCDTGHQRRVTATRD